MKVPSLFTVNQFFLAGAQTLGKSIQNIKWGISQNAWRISELFGGDKLVLRIRPNQFLLDDYTLQGGPGGH